MKRTSPREYIGPPASVRLTQAEAERLTNRTREAAVAVAEIFETLREINNRTGRTWEPGSDETTVRGIIDQLSSEVGNAAEAREVITLRRIEQIFADPQNWH